MDLHAFMPHGHCYLWRPDILWMHVASDVVIGLSYFSIPIALLFYIYKARSMGRLFSAVIILFTTFILLCGTTHFIDVWTTWHPNYFVEGFVKVLTAVVSIGTAIALWPLIPYALKIPSPEELKQVNKELEDLNESLEKKIDVATNEIKSKASDLEKSNRELLRSNSELDNFAYAASHDLRSPLRAVDNLAKWIAEDSADKLGDDSLKDLELLRKRVSRMDGMLEGLLQYSRLGRADFSREEFSLKELYTEIEELLDIPKDYEIIFEDFTGYINTSKPALQKVLMNLLDNSIKHKGDVGDKAKVGCEVSENVLHFTVEDNGPGIPEDQRGAVFGLFKTLVPKEEFESSGLGLSMVKKCIEQFGGDISIEFSKEGKGTLIKFSWSLQNGDG